MAPSKIKKSIIQKKLDEIRIKHKETEKLIIKLTDGLIQQNKNKAEYEGAIVVLHELLTGEKVE
ncbi:unnamed protein product [marine sediment metagenome]|uniref:Uncharacterized protein n=1 Tax=marine sediment metagenome TaxID=412755 RepID=X0ZVT2_9ZZZZ